MVSEFKRGIMNGIIHTFERQKRYAWEKRLLRT
nr:MAG TPA: hypothetical protein [Caudoviricetes sp.]